MSIPQNPNTYRGADGIDYDSELDYVCCAVLGFCGCGIPEETAEWVLRGLEAIDRPFQREEKEWQAFYPQWQDELRSLYGDNDAARYFFWYWCDDKGLTEHGGGVPGWLTDKGKGLRDRLKELLK